MKCLKQMTTVSIISLFASQMGASAIVIMEGNEDIKCSLTQKNLLK